MKHPPTLTAISNNRSDSKGSIPMAKSTDHCKPPMKESPTTDESEELKAVKASDNINNPRCETSNSDPAVQVSSSAPISVVLPGEFNPSIDAVLLRTLSASSLQGMSHNPSDSSIGCLPVEPSLEGSFRATETNQIPRRNLTEAFEELYIKPTVETETPLATQSNSKDFGGSTTNMISPTGVGELDARQPSRGPDIVAEGTNVVTPAKEDLNDNVPQFDLHSELQRDLSDALVNRVSFYAVIHDINKEATSMAANDESGFNRNPEEAREVYDPLVVAVNGYPKEPLPASSGAVKAALIDEERWLLDAIDARLPDESRSVNACPPTFLQAMGERDYENPLASLSNGSRTQLWKPSRSWWEAKSGKNPWIEPKSHNKRWRYLWPLIHYHKFLARCIKKLKRNGVDVKTSVSPVSVFLREEVCAVSDHLAAVSLFDSDEWMNCLQFFNGWTSSDEEAEETVRQLVGTLKLRPLNEPGDVDSPLLRSQIDEQYLRAMASARAQMSGAVLPAAQKENATKQREPARDGTTKQSSFEPVPATQQIEGPPPAYPKANASPPFRAPPGISSSPAGLRRPRWGYPSQHMGQWWGNGWNPHVRFPYGDDTSVQSGLSGESYSQHYDMSAFPGGMPHPQYFPPMMYPQHHMVAPHQGQYDPAAQDPAMYGLEGFNHEHMHPSGWMGHPHLGHVPPHMGEAPGYPGTPGAVNPQQDATSFQPTQLDASHPIAESGGMDQTPFKYNPAQMPMSPYWGHLDHATLAMMGIATPQGASAPQTPARADATSNDCKDAGNTQDEAAVTVNAQPLLLRQQYYGYGYGTREGYGPPSPATQFMMSPQASFAFNYGYGFSPRRAGSQKKKTNRTTGNDPDSRNDVAPDNKAPSASVTPTRPSANTTKSRESPATIETTAESESMS